MPQYLESPADDDWDALRRNVDQTDPRLNPPVPNARVFNSAGLTLTTGVEATVTFDSERWDNGGLHSTSTNTGRLTAPITGLYHIGCHIEFNVSGTGGRYVGLRANGTLPLAFDVRAAVAVLTTDMSVSTAWQLAAGEYVEVRAFQSSGGNLALATGSAYAQEFWMYRVSGFTNAGVG